MNTEGQYVQAQQGAFPFATRWVAGPFDTLALAMAEARRLGADYPLLRFAAKVRRVRGELPRLDPAKLLEPRVAAETGRRFDRSRVTGRREAAEAIAAYVRGLGVAVVVEDWDGEPDVDIALPTCRANIWLGWCPTAPMPLISWIAGEGRVLVGSLPGAWAGTYAHRKATSEPRDWPELFDMLAAGICAAIDGSAFE